MNKLLRERERERERERQRENKRERERERERLEEGDTYTFNTPLRLLLGVTVVSNPYNTTSV